MEVGLECWGVGEQIVFRGDVWSDECHGGVLIVGHQLLVLRQPPRIRACTPRPHGVAETPTTLTPARCATRRSTLPRRPHLCRVDAYTLAKTTPPRRLCPRRPPSRVRGCWRLRTISGLRYCSLRVPQRVPQLVVGEHAVSPHAPCACRCCCGPMLPRHVVELRTSRTPAVRNQTQAGQQ